MVKSMFDLVLRDATVVNAAGMAPLDVAILDGRVAALLAPGEPAEAQSTAHLSGRLLLPGLVDAHVHFRDPGMTWKEDFSTGTKAALAGGVTTALVMPTDDPWTTSPSELAAKRASAEGRLFCDIGLQVAAERPTQDVEALVALGAISFEVFTSDVPARFRHDCARAIDEAVRAITAGGGRIAVSPGNQSLLDAELDRLTPGRSSPEDFIRSRPALAEAAGIAEAILVAAERRAAVHLRQSSSRQAVEVYRALKHRAGVTTETGVQGLVFTGADYARLGPMAKASPPWRDDADRAALRTAVADGTIDIVVTDHAPHLLSEKLALADDFAAVPGGFPGVQTLLAVMLSLVDEGLIGLCDLVRLTASKPAEIFGLGARKGRIAAGYDADILVLDPQKRSVISAAAQLSKSSYTPFDGLAASMSLAGIYLRGEEAVRADGAVCGTPRGRVLS